MVNGRKEFIKKVRKLRVPNFLFNLDGVVRDDERFCLVKVGEKWNVYYSERGCKTTNEFFDTESRCIELYNKKIFWIKMWY